MTDKDDAEAQKRADEVIENANRDYRSPNTVEARRSEPVRNPVAAKPTVFNQATGVGPTDFDGTPPEEIAKMVQHRPAGNLPLGPGQVTGGASLRSGKASVARG